MAAVASAEGDQVALALRRQRSSREARTDTTTERLSGCSGCQGRERVSMTVGKANGVGSVRCSS
eukprot:5695790-Prymnesium_polylepis.1